MEKGINYLFNKMYKRENRVAFYKKKSIQRLLILLLCIPIYTLLGQHIIVQPFL